MVGYNVLRFDYEVLRAYTDDPLSDLPDGGHVAGPASHLGWRPQTGQRGFGDAGRGKSADGVQAVHWFRDGQLKKVIEYCRVMSRSRGGSTGFGQQNGYVQYRDRSWRMHKVPVGW